MVQDKTLELKPTEDEQDYLRGKTTVGPYPVLLTPAVYRVQIPCLGEETVTRLQGKLSLGPLIALNGNGAGYPTYLPWNRHAEVNEDDLIQRTPVLYVPA